MGTASRRGRIAESPRAVRGGDGRSRRRPARLIDLTLPLTETEVEHAARRHRWLAEIGLRAGTVRFDSTSPQISSEQLKSLYAPAEAAPELRDPIPEAAGEAPPVPMAWR